MWFGRSIVIFGQRIQPEKLIQKKINIIVEQILFHLESKITLKIMYYKLK